jgi:hypothetical protein
MAKKIKPPTVKPDTTRVAKTPKNLTPNQDVVRQLQKQKKQKEWNEYSAQKKKKRSEIMSKIEQAERKLGLPPIKKKKR